jgi:hypothetical protein
MAKIYGEAKKGDLEYEWAKAQEMEGCKALFTWVLSYLWWTVSLWFVLIYLIMSWGAGKWIPLY